MSASVWDLAADSCVVAAVVPRRYDGGPGAVGAARDLAHTRWRSADMSDATCSVDGCERSVRCKALCERHYRRLRRYGFVGPAGILPWNHFKDVTPSDRFWAKVDKEAGAPSYRPDLGTCWTWQAQTINGYGRFALTHSTTVPAHRFAWEEVNGDIPEGLQLDHLCRVRNCVRPSHLEAVVARVNVHRSFGPAALNVRKTHCPKGHPYDEANTYHHPRGQRVCIACRNEAKKRKRQVA